MLSNLGIFDLILSAYQSGWMAQVLDEKTYRLTH